MSGLKRHLLPVAVAICNTLPEYGHPNHPCGFWTFQIVFRLYFLFAGRSASRLQPVQLVRTINDKHAAPETHRISSPALFPDCYLKKNMKTTTAHWYVYMVSCADNSIYTGITTNLQRRILEHNSPRGGARYTRSRQPVVLVYYEEYPDRSLASKREFHLKKLSPGRKRALVTSTPVE